MKIIFQSLRMKRKTPSQNHSERAFSDAKFMLSELDPQGLVRPLEAEVGALDLAPRFAVLPEDEALEVMRSEILAKPLEVPRRILDDSLAMLLEKVIVKRIGVALEVRPDRLVCAIPERRAARVVVGGEMPVRARVVRIDGKPMRPVAVTGSGSLQGIAPGGGVLPFFAS